MAYSLTGLPWWLCGKKSTCSAGRPGSIPGLGRASGGGNGNPLQYSGLKKSHGQRSLVGYSPWGRKELDTTQWLTFWLWLDLFVNDILLWEGISLQVWAGNLWGQPSYISEPKGKNKNTEDPLNLLHGRVPTALKSPSLERPMELNKLHP